MQALLIQSPPDAGANVYPATWIVASNDAQMLAPRRKGVPDLGEIF